MGQLIQNRYEIVSEIGAGGMGMVYRGIDLQSNQTVAIKQLKRDISDAELIERFRREGEALRQLNHPNIVKMLDALEQDGQPYLILEYVPGGDLNGLLKAGSMPVERILNIALELADALTRAHHLKIIHRDLKPANVLIAEDGTPRLTDFGIARVGDSDITQSGVIIGTFAYVPPEALNSLPLDPRADIWSFGIMLFEMLAGRRPFEGSSMALQMNAILTQPAPDLEALRPDAPVALVDLVYRMLDKERDQRINSMRVIGAEIEAILTGNNTPNLAPRPATKTVVSDALQETGATTPSNTLHHLPVQTTSFVGRENELRELVALLDDPQVHLITVLGIGGIGKTRLAIEAAAHEQHFADGVYFVPLAPLEDASLIVRATADSVKFPLSAGEDSKQQLMDFLREKSILLVLDNFEHLISGVDLVNDLLKAAPGLKILATSRTRLNLQGETLYHVEGMDFPDWISPEDAAEYGAIKLFMHSVRRVQPGFTLTPDNMANIINICHVVQGLPLGIVLAAAWVDMLSLSEIATEIEKNIHFLETEQHDIPTRQRSIQAVFDYSWNLLTPEERAVFMQLSVFRGGFAREAAQTVSGASLKMLSSLANKSLIRRDPSGRYEIHELLRQFAAERLTENPEDDQAMRNKHADYYLALLDEQNERNRLQGPRVKERLAELRRENANLFAAWDEAVAVRKLDALINGFSSMLVFSFQDERWLEGHQSFRNAVDRLRMEHPTGLQGVVYALCMAANVFCGYLGGTMGTGDMHGDFPAERLEEAEAIVRASGDTHALSLYLQVISRLVMTQENDFPMNIPAFIPKLQEALLLAQRTGAKYEEAMIYAALTNASRIMHTPDGDAYAKRTLDLAQSLGDPILISGALISRGGFALVHQDFTRGREALTEAITQYSDVLSPLVNLLFTWVLSQILIPLGELEEARRRALEIISLSKRRGTRVMLARGISTLGQIAEIEGHLDEAEGYFQEALEAYRKTGDPLRAVEGLNQVARARITQAKWEDARKSLEEALDLVRHLSPSASIGTLVGLAYLRAKSDKPEAGVAVITFALAQPVFGVDFQAAQRAQHYLADLQSLLSPEAFGVAQEQAKALTLESAMAQIIE